MEDRTPWRTEHLCGITIKGKWEQDALWTGIRLFLESHPQNVADLGSNFCLVGLQKYPGLTVILVPDSNTMEDRTLLWHNNQSQMGAGRPQARHQVFFLSRTLQKLLI